MSGETCLTLPFRWRFAIVKSRRIVRIESEKSGKCHLIIVHSYGLHTFNHCFPCGYGFNPTKKGKKTVERDLNSVRHVFVGFVEGEESGIRNSESGIRNPFPFVISGKSFGICNMFLYLFFFCFNYRILSTKSLKSS